MYLSIYMCIYSYTMYICTCTIDILLLQDSYCDHDTCCYSNHISVFSASTQSNRLVESWSKQIGAGRPLGGSSHES